VATLTPPAQEKVAPRDLGHEAGAQRQEVVRCPYFVLERVALQAGWTCHPVGRTFIGLTCTRGSVTLSSPTQDWPDELLHPGGSLLLPAALEACLLQPVGGAAELLVARLP